MFRHPKSLCQSEEEYRVKKDDSQDQLKYAEMGGHTHKLVSSKTYLSVEYKCDFSTLSNKFI